MAASTERRSNDAVRVPLDALIELAHDDFGDRFEADCVNLSARGLSMRASYLPEPGTFLSCSFQYPAIEGTVKARGEVVWAESTGKRMGEFGVRFVGIDHKATRMIHEIVADVLARDTEPQGNAVYTSAKLSLDGVNSPIVAKVTHAAKDIVTVEQELSFLKLGRGVSMRVGDEQDARRGKIGGIDLSFAGEVPSLVLQVVYDETTANGDVLVAREEERTLTDYEAPKMDDIVGAAAPVMSATSSASSAPVVDVLASFSTRNVASSEMTSAVAKELKERDPVRIIRTEGDLEKEVATFKNTGTVGAMIATAWTAFIAVAGPILQKLWMKVRDASVEFGKKAMPVISENMSRTGRTMGHLAGVMRNRAAERFPMIGTSARGKKRVTSPAPSTSQRPAKRVQGAVAEVEEKASSKKTLVLAGVVLVAAASAFYFFNRTDDDLGSVAASASARQAAPQVAAPLAPVAAAPVAPNPELGAVSPGMPQAQPVAPAAALALAPPPSAAIPAAAPVAAAPASVQTPPAMPAPTYEAGRLPAPTFPSLRDAPRPAAAPNAVPANSPYAVDVRAANGNLPAAVTAAAAPQTPGLMTFGAPSLSGGLIYTLRMDGRITGITGARARTTLSIRVNGARSLDRAAPVFARNPQIERAAIVNSVDHADLTIQFKEGMAPNYRVVARGDSLEVMLSR